MIKSTLLTYLLIASSFLCGAFAYAQINTQATDTASPQTGEQKSEQLAEQAVAPNGEQINEPIAPPAIQNFEVNFRDGVKAYENKNYNLATEKFNLALKERPEDTGVLLNLALAEYQVQKLNLAVAHLRDLLKLNPYSFDAQRALEYIVNSNPIKEIPRKTSLYESIRTNVLNYFTLDGLLLILWCVLFAATLVWTRYLRKYRDAHKSEMAAPHVPVSGVLLAMSVLVLVSLVIFKTYDLNIPRGTIIVDNVELLSSPSSGSVKLGELYGGVEVMVIGKDGDWVQIEYPGAISGWAKSESVYIY